jgi:hypothetical protein
MGGPPYGEAERELRRVYMNMKALTCAVSMVDIEYLPPTMQPHVVGVPRTWVQLFWYLANVIVHYTRSNKPSP